MKGSILLISVLLISSSIPMIPSSEAQIVPEIEISCEDPEEIEVFPGAEREKETTVYCILENPNPYSETVQLTYQQGVLMVSGPGSVTVSGSSSESFEIEIRSDTRSPPLTQIITISAEVTEAGGFPVSGTSQIETVEVTIVVLEYMFCNYNFNENKLLISSGKEISFSSDIDCSTNIYGNDEGIQFQAMILSEGSSSSPNGFDDVSDICQPIRLYNVSCDFEFETSLLLFNSWKGCIEIIEVGEIIPDGCSGNESITLEVVAITDIISQAQKYPLIFIIIVFSSIIGVVIRKRTLHQ